MNSEDDGANSATDSAWMTKAEALKALGVSERSLDRKVTRGEIQKSSRPRPGRTPEPLYHRGDVERLTARAAYPMPEQPGGALVAPREAQARDFPALGASLAQALAIIEAARRARPLAPLWLDLDQASAHSGLSARKLRSLIRAGELPALRDGRGWKVRRADLRAIRGSAKRATSAPAARPKKSTG